VLADAGGDLLHDGRQNRFRFGLRPGDVFLVWALWRFLN
jgi:hypothetical protein